MSRKPTQAEQAERIELCERMIAAGRYDGEIKRAVASRFGCSPRTVERYLRRARNNLVARRSRQREELQGEGLAFYESVIRDPKAPTRDKLRARHRIDQLLGLDEPQRLEHSGVAGGPIEVETVGRDLMEKMDRDPAAMALAGRLAEHLDGGDGDGPAPAATPQPSLNGHEPRNGNGTH